jgi:hypothetical protein
MEEALRADPGAVADDHARGVVALQDRLVPDVDVGADLDRLRVEDEDAGLEDHGITQAGELLDLE